MNEDKQEKVGGSADGTGASDPAKTKSSDSGSSQEQNKFKRAPSKLVNIKELNSEMSRVSFVGTIISKNPELYSFMIDDGTGTVLVLTNNIEKFNELREEQLVRVFGRVWGEAGEIEIQSDIIQDFSKIDIELFRKVYK